MVRRPPAMKETANNSCENSHCLMVPNVPPPLRIEDRDPVPEEQELEAYVEDITVDNEFSREDVFLFTPEERERQKREREESKRVLQELKAVLGLKASEEERQKWKQLLFSDHAAVKPLTNEQTLNLSTSTEEPEYAAQYDCKTQKFHEDVTQLNGTEPVHKEATTHETLDLPVNDHINEMDSFRLLEKPVLASSKENLEPRPEPRTVLPASIKERLTRIHQSSDLHFASGVAAQVAARSLTFTFFQEQTFGDEWDDDDDNNDTECGDTQVQDERNVDDRCSEHEE